MNAAERIYAAMDVADEAVMWRGLIASAFEAAGPEVDEFAWRASSRAHSPDPGRSESECRPARSRPAAGRMAG